MDLTIQDVSELFELPQEVVEKWTHEGKLPAYLLEEQHRFSRIEIEDWFLKNRLEVEVHRAISPSLQEPIVSSSSKGGSSQFCLYRALHQGDLFSDVAGNKEEVIREVATLVAKRQGVDPEILTELLLDREQMMPTALGSGIAVPHTRELMGKEGVDRIFVVYPKEPLDYGALDGHKVHTLFFLFSCDDKIHLQLLAKLAHLSVSGQAVSLLTAKPNKKKLLAFILDWEDTQYYTKND